MESDGVVKSNLKGTYLISSQELCLLGEWEICSERITDIEQERTTVAMEHRLRLDALSTSSGLRLPSLCRTAFFAIALLCTIAANRALSQPGGGGGFLINGLYDANLKRIDFGDSTLSIRLFTLVDSTLYSSIERELYIRDLGSSGSYYSETSSSTSFGADTKNDEARHKIFRLPPDKYRRVTWVPVNYSNQRLVLIYRGDTMVVDVAGVLGENGGGYIDFIDSLVFRGGYLWLNRRPSYDEERYSDAESLFASFNHGVTPQSFQQYSSLEWCVYRNTIPPVIKDSDVLPATYYLSRGEHRLRKELYVEAIADLWRAIKGGIPSVDSAEAFVLLCDAYVGINDYENAIKSISDLIAIEYVQRRVDYNGETENLISLYRIRIDLYTKTGRYRDAIQDFASIISLSNWKIYPRIERAQYIQQYLQNCQWASDEFGDILSWLLADKSEYYYEKSRSYSDICRSLAKTKLCIGNYDHAVDLLLNAATVQRSSYVDNALFDLTDSLTKMDPKNPRLLLARAILYVNMMLRFKYSSEKERSYMIRADSDLKAAQRLGMEDYRINKHRAMVLLNGWKYDQALEQVNLAIEKNSADPQLFSLRYQIRQKIDQAEPKDKSDPDVIEAQLKMKTWNPLK